MSVGSIRGSDSNPVVDVDDAALDRCGPRNVTARKVQEAGVVGRDTQAAVVVRIGNSLASEPSALAM